ncbi:cation diffusion facilitator family transporter [Devosia sp. YIM 151766]|uniref:cation diffusion facilitator family transporter n=1 Tax=Devosia sp. YIM 151766 TaxID=3017325 RepID=UPI00255C62D0|nr:cation diffusion facilitator family transporter [Devosia sp. YIM 151766]WIY52218.1 cation diffusion facilitator family transporter [Devosia sp. YIM 151766]
MMSAPDPHHHHQHSGHAHDHDHAGHSHAPKVSAGNERAVLIGLLLTGSFMLVELIGGVLSGSLALIADAGHMLTDTVALFLAWLGFRLGRRPADARRSFGYSRLEVLAGLINAITLFALVAWIAYEAVQRFLEPQEVLAGPMLVVAVLGLLINLLVFRILSTADADHVNIKGALLHVLGDLLGSVGAIAAAIIIWLTGWMPIDPILSVLVSLLILRSAWALLMRTFNILMEGAPDGFDPAQLQQELLANIPGLAGVGHLHVWSLSSGQTMATLEIQLAPRADPAKLTAAVRDALWREHGVNHATIEIDWSGEGAACPAQSPGGSA